MFLMETQSKLVLMKKKTKGEENEALIQPGILFTCLFWLNGKM